MEIFALVFFVACLVLAACVLCAGLVRTARFERECDHRDAAVMPVLVAAGVAMVALFDVGTGSPLLAAGALGFALMRTDLHYRGDRHLLGVYPTRAEVDAEIAAIDAVLIGGAYYPTDVVPLRVELFLKSWADSRDHVAGFLAWAWEARAAVVRELADPTGHHYGQLGCDLVYALEQDECYRALGREALEIAVVDYLDTHAIDLIFAFLEAEYDYSDGVILIGEDTYFVEGPHIWCIVDGARVERCYSGDGTIDALRYMWSQGWISREDLATVKIADNVPADSTTVAEYFGF